MVPSVPPGPSINSLGCELLIFGICRGGEVSQDAQTPQVSSVWWVQNERSSLLLLRLTGCGSQLARYLPYNPHNAHDLLLPRHEL